MLTACSIISFIDLMTKTLTFRGTLKDPVIIWISFIRVLAYRTLENSNHSKGEDNVRYNKENL